MRHGGELYICRECMELWGIAWFWAIDKVLESWFPDWEWAGKCLFWDNFKVYFQIIATHQLGLLKFQGYEFGFGVADIS